MTINECIEKLNSYIKDVEAKANEKIAQLDPETRKQVEAIATKTSETIKKSIDKLNDLKSTVTDEASVNDFLTKLDAKCKDIVDYTANKISEIKPEAQSTLDDFINNLDNETKETREDLKNKAEKTYKDVEFKLNDTYTRMTNTPFVQSGAKMVKKGIDTAVDFYNSDETQEFINVLKVGAVNVAEKALDGLKVVLDRKDDDKNVEDVETQGTKEEDK